MFFVSEIETLPFSFLYILQLAQSTLMSVVTEAPCVLQWYIQWLGTYLWDNSPPFILVITNLRQSKHLMHASGKKLNFLKWLSLAVLAVPCMQSIVESSLKTFFFFFLKKFLSFACLPHCPEVECHERPQSGAWLYYSEKQTVSTRRLPQKLLPLLLGRYCMGRQLFIAQDFSCAPLPSYW